MSLNIESCFSFNGSLIKREDVKYMASLGYKALGIADNNSAFFFPFYEECLKEGIKPLLALRLKGKVFDYLLYAKNFKGYQDLLSIASENEKGRIYEIEEILKSKDVIYCFDLTYTSSDKRDIVKDEYSKVKEKQMEIYLGVDFSYYPCEIELYPKIKNFKDIIIIHKVKYLTKEDKKASDILEAVLAGTELKEVSLFDLDLSEEKYLPTREELGKIYKDYPNLMDNTERFISLIDIKIEVERRIPLYPIEGDIPSSVYLRKLSEKGLSKRLSGTSKDPKVYKERLNYELGVIENMGFSDYFLIVYDYVFYAKKHNILVGPGRGSSASSLVSYSLGIVDVDPIEYSLYFERFLNPARKTMPDIDTDFEDTKRDEVVKYVTEKYGRYHAVTIATFQTFLAKSALRDVSKLLEISDSKVNLLSKEIEKDNSLASLMSKPNIKKYYETDPDYKSLIDISLKIEGLPRSIGTHAAGIIITTEDIREYSEVHNGLNDVLQTSYDADTLKDLGLLKMDFLALKNLSVIHDILDDIKKNEGVTIALSDIKFDDAKTYKMLKEKSTLGVFQLETPGMTDLYKKMDASSFLDLSLCIALFRPGPMENIPAYLRRRNKEEKIDYYDDSIKDILKETLGIIVYQEQMMSVASVYAGLTLSEADILRRAMSSKDSSLISELKEKFYEGSKKLGRNYATTERLYNDIYRFSGYGFNKSHSVAYGFVSYYLAYLKTHYPSEFMANLLKNNPSPKYFKECLSLGIKVLPPDMRFSSFEFIIIKGVIYMPFSSIKGVGASYAKEIEKVVKAGDVSFESIIKRAKESLPRSLIEVLIMAGAFDYTGYNKRTMIEALPGLYDFDPSLIKGLDYKVKKTEEYDFDYLKTREMDLLGYNPKYHPLKAYNGSLRRISDLSEDDLDKTIEIVSYISFVKEIKTKAKGERMASLDLEDEYESMRGIIFPRDYNKCAHFLKKGAIYSIIGTYKIDDRGEKEIVVRNIKEETV